jgi:hypothetical protein
MVPPTYDKKLRKKASFEIPIRLASVRLGYNQSAGAVPLLDPEGKIISTLEPLSLTKIIVIRTY